MPTFTFGLDISHHQGAFDLARAKREGITFVILKATEGDGFIDSRFLVNLAAARRAGLLVAAYHYQRAGVSAAAQVAHIRQVVPANVPVIPDVEANSGSVGLTRDIASRLRVAGYRVPLLYLPRWYWQQIGSPSLSGLPPLWSSRYPDNVVGSLSDEFADVPAHYWDGYGGLPVRLLQFTSSVRIAGRSPIDANAFRGTRAQLAALLGGEVEDDDMPTPAELWGYEGEEDDDAWQILRDIRDFVRANPDWSIQKGWLASALSDMQKDNEAIKTQLAALAAKLDAGGT